MSETTLHLQFGGMALSLLAQLQQHRVPCIDVMRVEQCQYDADAVTRLRIRGLLSEAVAEKARRQIVRDVIKATVAQ